MDVFVFGNPDLKEDSLPLKILSDLKKQLPDFNFVVRDPNEEWDVSEELIIIDTVLGIDKITIFNDLKEFVSSPRVSLHDFDVFTNLLYLQKLGKLKKIKIIGLPPMISENNALESIKSMLLSSQP